eukprot:Selendium_serpulae@DN4098_c0_g1_i1.p1
MSYFFCMFSLSETDLSVNVDPEILIYCQQLGHDSVPPNRGDLHRKSSLGVIPGFNIQIGLHRASLFLLILATFIVTTGILYASNIEKKFTQESFSANDAPSSSSSQKQGRSQSGSSSARDPSAKETQHVCGRCRRLE